MLSKLTFDGEEVGRFPVGTIPYRIVFDGVGELPFDIAFDGEAMWTANSGDGTASRISLDGDIIGVYPVGSAPANVLFDGEAIWVTNTSDDTVSKITFR